MMTGKLQNILGLAALGLTLLSYTVPTWAGTACKPEVSIQRFSTRTDVVGSMAGARYSTDSTQYIGCSINAAPFVVCEARNRAGQFASCISYNASHIGAIQGMTDSSAIRFVVNNGSTDCTYIVIYGESCYLP